MLNYRTIIILKRKNLAPFIHTWIFGFALLWTTLNGQFSRSSWTNLSPYFLPISLLASNILFAGFIAAWFFATSPTSLFGRWMPHSWVWFDYQPRLQLFLLGCAETLQRKSKLFLDRCQLLFPSYNLTSNRSSKSQVLWYY